MNNYYLILTACVLSKTANLLRATHTAVNPDALLPSDTRVEKKKDMLSTVSHKIVRSKILATCVCYIRCRLQI